MSRSSHPDDELAGRLATECFGAAPDTQETGRDKGPVRPLSNGRKERAKDKRKEERGKRKERALKDPRGDEPETRLLLAEYEAGELEPVWVELGEMPAEASTKARQVAAEMRLAMGLRARVGERRPLPFSTPFACERLGWGKNYRKASLAIRELEGAGTIRCVGELPPQRGRARGTKLYE